MDIEQIRRGVYEGADKWAQMGRLRGGEFRLTEGALELVVTMVDNIRRDPSPVWAAHEYDAVQAYVLAILPNILADIGASYRWRNRLPPIFSSWEILHGISEALEKWCPIPKDI